MSLLRKVMFSYVLAAVFIAVYETARVSFDLGEFRFVGPMFVVRPASSLVIMSFVALLAWVSLILLERYADSSFYVQSPFLEVVTWLSVYTIPLGLLYFLTSPFVGWALSVFSGPHRSLFEFYGTAWQKFDGLDGLSLALASCLTGLLVLLVVMARGWWEHCVDRSLKSSNSW